MCRIGDFSQQQTNTPKVTWESLFMVKELSKDAFRILILFREYDWRLDSWEVNPNGFKIPNNLSSENYKTKVCLSRHKAERIIYFSTDKNEDAYTEKFF